MEHAVEHLKKEFVAIRAGKATPAYAQERHGRLLWVTNTLKPGCQY